MPDRNFTPFPVLQTERLTLRPLTLQDDEQIFALRSDAAVNRYLDRKPSETIADARAFIEAIQEHNRRNESLYWAIECTGTDRLIGTICLFGFSGDPAQAEIGYELLPGFQGKGIMQEALSAVIAYATGALGLRSLEAGTHRDNEGSTKLLEKFGFQRQGADGHFLLYKRTTAG
ncbi:GNAT family N-acetyltransferase [Flaviaesturariibacter aridisoli]|uniref:N-acetyltransferase n=1 Tax=Flaviaesturariibacter aridisoli TaxID=2545761 RepID=A0A4R4DSI8_9BACT|nr:GNAT family N-acetyltransferase [Flaviaesturariibacter aridisoli]TCZ64716.1 N-acetyltransferase [Flaviaesturariibacter aridisoli]